MDSVPGALQSKESAFLNKFQVCENILFLGSLPVISSGDNAELHATLRQIVKDYGASPSGATSQPKPFVFFSFSIADESAHFSVINQQSFEVVQGFDAAKVAFCFSTWMEDTRGYVVFTYLDESPDSTSTASKWNYYCFVYQCSSLFEVSYAAVLVSITSVLHKTVY
ncbi:hypothetical protein EmuJ_000150500 [Echinococcus multilocularis]|uniref:Uncharacterized protein n=1 Tax=Echinococcus multilocularis TaxID=6211 RepID=A0A087VZG1_ECHMU|nr:hypothetical protein EmuJ_000150500 [Echinococcus multilocularis]